MIIVLFSEPHSAKDIEKEFLKYEDDIIQIVNFISEAPYDNISILDTMDNGEWFAYNDDELLGRVNESRSINDLNISNKISYIFKNGHYQNIDKCDNIIFFNDGLI